MGRDRHHYDKRGKYKGYTSDSGPGSWIGGAILFFIIVWLLRGC